MRKLNWKSVLPLVMTIFAPQLAGVSNSIGVQIFPAMIGGIQLGMLFVSLSSLLPLVQPILLILGGLLANGVERGLSDWKTNFISFGTAVFAVIGGLGFNFSPSLKENILQLGAMLVAIFSENPDTDIPNDI